MYICIEKSARCLRFQQVNGHLLNGDGECHRIVFANRARGQLPVGQFVRDLSVRLTMRNHDNERAEMEPERRTWRRKPDSPRITTRAASSPSGNSTWKRFLDRVPRPNSPIGGKRPRRKLCRTDFSHGRGASSKFISQYKRDITSGRFSTCTTGPENISR